MRRILYLAWAISIVFYVIAVAYGDHWFARSDSLMVLLGAISEFKLIDLQSNRLASALHGVGRLMYILGYFLQAIAGVIHVVLMTVMIVVIARAVLSWVSPDPHNPIVRLINQFSEPLLFPVRKRVPYIGGIDLSPLIVLLAVMFLDNFLVPTLQRMAFQMTQGG